MVVNGQRKELGNENEAGGAGKWTLLITTSADFPSGITEKKRTQLHRISTLRPVEQGRENEMSTKKHLMVDLQKLHSS
jgi:hypothetical protein